MPWTMLFEAAAFTAVVFVITAGLSIFYYHLFHVMESASTRLRRWMTRKLRAKHRATQPPHAARQDFELRRPDIDLDDFDETRHVC